jgi:hypothetical protein
MQENWYPPEVVVEFNCVQAPPALTAAIEEFVVTKPITKLVIKMNFIRFNILCS